MVPVERTEFAQLKSYLCQADGVMIAALKAGENTVPDPLQYAFWAAAGLIERALQEAEQMERRGAMLADGDGI